MKTYLYILVLMSLLSCKKNDVVEVPEPQQTQFDNIPACCSGDCLKQELWQVAYKDVFEIKNITGVIQKGSVGYIAADKMIIDVQVDAARFPEWVDYRRSLYPCNMPNKLKSPNKDLNIRFDFRILTMKPLRANGSVIDVGGHTIELIKLEVLP